MTSRVTVFEGTVRRASGSGLGAHLERLGYVADEDAVPAMGIDLAEVPPLLRDDRVELSIAAGGLAVEALQRLCAAGFGPSSAIADPLAQVMRRVGDDASSPIRIVAASIDGCPAATALASTLGEIAGLYDVATLPEHRGRDLGQMVTLVVRHDAASGGARLSVLEASRTGHSMYARIGFVDA